MKILTQFGLLLCCFMAISSSAFAQSSPVGTWKTIDDVSGEAKSHIEIYERDGRLYGKVIKLLADPEDSVCSKCDGADKDKPLIGLEILKGLKPYKDYWSYGRITDPNNGKTYKCSVWLKTADQLKLRGYVGISALGRNQIWHRLK